MSVKLRELIRSVRACKTAAEERAVIAKECALIRTAFKQKVDTGFRHRNVAKLLYIHMLGYPTHFGQMESLKLIASPRFPEKRIGYLGLMILLDERQEVLMLVTNSLKNDLHHRNPYVVGLALASLGNIASADMARDLYTEVIKLFRNANPYIRKKAAITAIRCVRKEPELVEDFVQPAVNLLQDKNHAVLLADVSLIIELTRHDRKVVKQFRKLVPLLVKMLKNLLMAGYVSEYDVCGLTDPFLQAKLLQLLRVLGTGSSSASEEMNDILAQVAINTDSNKNPGNAILYECVQTIMSIKAEHGLRVLAVNILGRFLVNRDNNIRYVALSTLCQVVQKDTKAIQRHRNTIVDCLKDSDTSIRRRSLDLIYALVTKSNVRPLVTELLNYLRLASGDHEFKSDLTDKICIVVDKYAPNKRWHIDTTIQVLSTAGNYVREQVPSNLIGLISRSKTLHAYSVHKIYTALLDARQTEHHRSRQLPLVHVTMWTIGEYGQFLTTDEGAAAANDAKSTDDATVFEPRDENKVLDLLDEYIRDVHSTAVTRGYIINALIKLSNRFSVSRERLQQLIDTYKGSMNAELQQRSVEYSALLSSDLDEIRTKVFSAMPQIPKNVNPQETDENTTEFTDSEDEPSEAESESGDESSSESGESSDDEDEEPTPKSKSKPKAAPVRQESALDVLDMFDDPNGFGASAAADPQPAPATANGGASNGLNILDDIFAHDPTPAQPVTHHVDPLDMLIHGTGGPPAAQPQPQVQPQQPAGKSKPGSTVAFDKAGLTVHFAFRQPAPNKTQVRASFSNANGAPLTDFDFKVAVPKYLKLRLKPASATVVPPNSNNKVVQLFELENTQHGIKKNMIRIKIDYKISGQAVSELTQFKNFPA